MYPTRLNGYKNDKATEFSDKFKATVALEALRGDKTVQEIASKRQLHPTQVSTWKRQAIEGMANVFSDKVLCRVLEISRGWFYGFLASQPARDQCHADRKVRDLALLPKINTFFKASRKCYGSKRIHQDLVNDGEVVSERRVARIMKKKQGICAPEKALEARDNRQ